MNNVEIYINNQLVDLKDDEDIVQSYAVNKFGDIASRNSSYSNNFSLPITANNRAIFESPDILVNNSTIPYEQLTCQIFVDGIIVVTGFAQLTGVSDSYKIKVFGTNFDFFSKIKSKFLSELDLSAYDHTWNLANVAGSRTNTSGYIYGLICYQAELSDNYFPITNRGVDVRQLYPGMFMHTIIDKIISEAGFTKSTDAIWTDEKYLSIVIPFSNDELFDDSVPNQEDFKAIKTSDQIINSASLVVIPFQNDSTGGAFDNGGNYNTGTGRYIVPFACVGSFTINMNVAVSGIGGSFRITLAQQSVGLVAILNCTQAANTTVNYTLNSADLNLIAGEYMEVSVDETIVGSIVIQQGASFESHIQAGFLFDITMSDTVPKIKQGDFFKWFLQKFQAVCVEKNGVVNVRTFGEIANNTANAKDWSNKVDETEEAEVQFNIDTYAQINNLKYKDDDSVVKPSGTDYELLIDNENLEAETDIIISPFAATEMITRLISEVVPQIKHNTGLEITEKVEPRVLILNQRDVTDAIVYDDATSTISTTTSIPFMYFILPGEEFNLGFEDNLIPLYGEEVVDVLQEQKVARLLIRINSSDINQLDFFIPIWLDKYNCYFFISNIEQYKVNSVDSTIVELVKLPS